MRLLTFRPKKEDHRHWHLGVQIGDRIGSLKDGYRRWSLRERRNRTGEENYFRSMRVLLEGGAEALSIAREVTAFLDQSDSGLYDEQSIVRGPTVIDPSKLICIGLNYRDHCREYGMPLPKEPVLFSKLATAILAPDEPIIRPRIVKKLDCEGELAVVIGRGGRHLSVKESPDYIAGYSIINDVTARDLQAVDGQWLRSKSFDTFAPLGPSLTTSDEVSEPQDLSLRLSVNNRVLQHSTTKNMIFDIPYLVSFLSGVCTLSPGDVIATGTPAGVGAYHDPPVFLRGGDLVAIDIEGLGVLRNPVVEESDNT